MQPIKLILAVLFLMPVLSYGQDPQFAQHFFAPMYYNPAFTGFQQNVRAGLQYRSESGGNIKSLALTADMGVPAINSGIGILGLCNVQRPPDNFTTNMLGLCYAYEFKLGEASYLRAGLDALFFMQISNKVLTANPTEDYKEQIAQSPNFALGALYYTNRFYAGASAYNVIPNQEHFRPNDQEVPTETRYNLQAGAFFNINDFVLNPNISFINQGDFSELMPGMEANYKSFTLGASYISNYEKSGFNFLAGITKGVFKVGYSYGYSFNPPYQNLPWTPTHEVTLVVQLNKPRDTTGKPLIQNMRKAF